MGKFISDIITNKEICQWSLGERILISAGTGHGKTTFITGSLLEHCRKNNKKALLLVNRVLLKNQINASFDQENETLTEEEYFRSNYDPALSVRLYQSVEEEIKRRDYNDEGIFGQYDYIICDEAHYFLTDSEFSLQTDLVLKSVMKNHPQAIVIFMTATPINLIDADIVRPTKRYSVKTDNSHIKGLYFYSKRNIPELICKSVPDGEKLLYFGNAQLAYDLHKMFDDSEFFCAETNSFSRYNTEGTAESITQGSFFSKYLFTTRVLDNGISIHDENVKHIIIDDSIDPITVLQMLGRRRILHGVKDQVNIYIRKQMKWTITGTIHILRKELKDVDEYEKVGKESFVQSKKKSRVSSLFDSDMELNIAKVYNKRFKVKVYARILSLLGGYEEFICNLLDFPYENIKSANQEYQRLQARDVLKKYSGKKLQRDEQKKFIQEFMVAILDPRKEKPVGLSTIRGILEDNNFPYIIESRQEREKGSSNRYRYWYITEII